MKHHNLFLRSLSLVHEVENVVVRHPSRGDLLCFAQGDSNHRRRQTMCSRQCFHWHMCFRIGRFRFPKRKLWWRKSSSRSEQSSTVPVDFRCLRGQWVRRSAQWNRSESRMSFFISLSDAVKVSSGKRACLLLSSSESEQYDRWRCVWILSVTKKKRGWHSSEWCFAFPLKSSPCFLLISGQMKFSSRSRTSIGGHWNWSRSMLINVEWIYRTSIWNRWWWSWQLSPSPAASLDTSVLLLHAISGDLSPSEILVSGKSRNRLEIVFWSNPVVSSSGTISSIVSVAGQVSVDHSDRWRLFFEVHSPRLISIRISHLRFWNSILPVSMDFSGLFTVPFFAPTTIHHPLLPVYFSNSILPISMDFSGLFTVPFFAPTTIHHPLLPVSADWTILPLNSPSINERVLDLAKVQSLLCQ